LPRHHHSLAEKSQEGKRAKLKLDRRPLAA
jgi:hypothetical protein